MIRAWFFIAIAGTALCGCQPVNNVCGSQEQQLLAPDGGEVRCVQAQDCPRPNNVNVCVLNGTPETECVSCTDTRCVRHVPEPCQ